MQTLKTLVDKVREDTKTQSEITEGDGRASYKFDTEYFPNASEYSNTNKGVGRRLSSEDDDTISFVGENFVDLSGVGNALDEVGNVIDDTFDVVNPIVRKFINDEDFVLTQTKLRAMNRLSGKIFNPLGILASYLDDEIDGEIEDSPLLSVLSQTFSYITGRSGETFYSVFDKNAHGDRFSLDGFKSSVEGDGLTSNAFLREALSTAGEIVGLDFPTRSIVAQVLSYNNTLFSDVSDTSTGWLGIGDERRTTYEDVIEPIGIKAINYLYDSELIVKDPAKYYELSQKISRGLMAGNVMVKKPDDLIKEEEKSLLKYGGNAILDRLFGVDIGGAKGFYINKRKQFSPDQENITDDLLKYFLSSLADNDLTPSKDLYGFLDNVIENKLPDGRIQSIERDRFIKSDLYGGNDGREKTDNEKLQGLKDNSDTDYIDENNHPEKYRYHNIQVQLGEDFRSRLKDKSFSNLKNISEEHPQDDAVNIEDITGYTGDTAIEGDLGTNQFMAIEDVGNKKIIYLRPSFENISEDIQVNNGDFFYVGRTEPFPNYENTTRSVTMSFKLYADTPNEFLIMWKKMSFLNSLAYPTMSSTDYKNIKNPLLRFTVGDLFKRIGGYLNTLNFVYSNSDATWETEKGLMAPKIIDVSMSFTVLHDSMPYVNTNNNFEFGENDTFSPYSVDYDKFSEEQ